MTNDAESSAGLPQPSSFVNFVLVNSETNGAVGEAYTAPKSTASTQLTSARDNVSAEEVNIEAMGAKSERVPKEAGGCCVLQ